MSADWPISEVTTPFNEVRLVGWSGLILLTPSSSHFDPMYGPAVRSKRFIDQVVSGLASMYPAFDWSIRSGPSWISARVRSH